MSRSGLWPGDLGVLTTFRVGSARGRWSYPTAESGRSIIRSARTLASSAQPGVWSIACSASIATGPSSRPAGWLDLNRPENDLWRIGEWVHALLGHHHGVAWSINASPRAR